MEKDINRIQVENFMYNLTFLRKKFGISKRKMAELLQVDLRTLTKIENGIVPGRTMVRLLFEIEDRLYIPCGRLLRERLDEES